MLDTLTAQNAAQHRTPPGQAEAQNRAPPDRSAEAQNTMERLKQRADFLAAAAGAKAPAAAFILQVRERDDAAPSRFGFTVSRKVGTAVERNRVRRRLKEIVRRSAALPRRTGHDYVLIGRRTALNTPFERMIAEFAGALKRVHGAPRARRTGENGI